MPTAVTLEQLLSLAGPLDDTRGFDAPRARFRRFLREHVTDAATARRLIEQGRHAPDDQHRRALADLVVLLGRFMGFEIEFGSAAVSLESASHAGSWYSPGRLRVIVSLAAPLVDGATAVETLTQIVAADSDAARASHVPLVGLLVQMPLAATRQTLERIASKALSSPVRVVPLETLLTLAGSTATGSLEHADIVRVFESDIPVDFVLKMIKRPGSGDIQATPEPRDVPAPAAPVQPTAPRTESGYWVAGVPAEHAMPPEDFLQFVVARRHVFGVTEKGAPAGIVRAGDSICFYLSARGVVGRANVESVADGNGELRDARLFRQVLRLQHLVLHLDRPIALDAETELRLRAMPPAGYRQPQLLLEIPAESFRAITGDAGKLKLA